MEEFKTCKECQIQKPITEFYTHHNGKYHHRVCKECMRKKSRNYWNEEYKNERNKERKQKYKKDDEFRRKIQNESRQYVNEHKDENIKRCSKYYNSNKQKVLFQIHNKQVCDRVKLIEMLGGKCVSCDETEKILLVFDHIKPIFSRIRKINNLREVKKYPERFQLLCANCHRRKTINDLKEYWEKRRM